MSRIDPTAEAELIRRTLDGDSAAFRPIVEAYERSMKATAYQYVRNREEAADICQEALMKAFEKLDTFRGDSSLSTWLHTIVKNLSINHLKSGRSSLEK
jgi:RNA polymerase sigma-70 factor (ECF subfamily)